MYVKEVGRGDTNIPCRQAWLSFLYNVSVLIIILFNYMLGVRLEAFMATGLDSIFSGNKQCQLWETAQRFGEHLCRHYHFQEGMKMFVCYAYSRRSYHLKSHTSMIGMEMK